MAEPEPITLLRETVDGFLRKSFDDVRVADDGDFAVQRDGVTTWVQLRPVEQDQTAVLIWSASSVGMTVDAEMTRFLATEGNNLAFGQFELHEGPPRVHVSHALLGEFLSREELAVAVEAVSEASAQYGRMVKERFGGVLPSEFVVEPAAEPPPMLTPAAAGARVVDRPKIVRAAFVLAGLAAGVLTAVYAYRHTSSWLVSLFLLLSIATLIARAMFHVVTGSNRIARAIYFVTPPAVGSAVLFVAYTLSSRWWLAVLLACASWVIARGLTNAAYPAIATEGMSS